MDGSSFKMPSVFCAR